MTTVSPIQSQDQAGQPIVSPVGKTAKKTTKQKLLKTPKTATAPKTAKPKVPSSHPTYSQMIKSALGVLKGKKGTGKGAILKYIISHYKVGDNQNKVNALLKQALKRGVQTGELKQVKGVGASGSFNLPDKNARATAKPKAEKSVSSFLVKKRVGVKKPKSPVKKKAIAKPKSPAKKKTATKSVLHSKEPALVIKSALSPITAATKGSPLVKKAKAPKKAKAAAKPKARKAKGFPKKKATGVNKKSVPAKK